MILATQVIHFEDAKALFKEYALSLPIKLDFQHFDEELNIVNIMYAAPNGALYIIYDQDKAIGCAGIRYLEEGICELKRMYIQPAYRKLGYARILMEDLLNQAIILGYHTMRLDTLSEMIPAIRLYKQFGFYEIPSYYYNPNETVVYMEKSLK